MNGGKGRTLLIAGLPRSLTTVVHRYASEVLDLPAPSWAAAGEFLNPDRTALAGGAPGRLGGGRAYLTAEVSPLRFRAAVALCDRLIAPTGEALKDVVQPFVVVAQLRAAAAAGRPTPVVIILTRDVAEVAAGMIARGWEYPLAAARTHGPKPRRIVEGLLRADTALRSLTTGDDTESLAAITLDVADLVRQPSLLTAALTRLYPDQPPLPPWNLGKPPPCTATAPTQDLRAMVTEARAHLRPLDT